MLYGRLRKNGQCHCPVSVSLCVCVGVSVCLCVLAFTVSCCYIFANEESIQYHATPLSHDLLADLTDIIF